MKYFLSILLMLSLALSEQYEAIVYLKDGSVVRGVIIDERKNFYIQIKSEGRTLVYQASEIKEIVKNSSSRDYLSEPKESKINNSSTKEPKNQSDSSSSSDVRAENRIDKDKYIFAGMGIPLFISENINNRYDWGPAFSLQISTPFELNVMDKDVPVSATLTKHNLIPLDDYYISEFSPMNIGALFSTDIMMLDAMLGTGLSMASGSAGWGDGPYGQDYSMITLYYTIGASYNFLLNSLISDFPLEGLLVSASVSSTSILGSPDDSGDSSGFLNIGCSIGYPINW